ncbi:glycosyltransferase [Catenovulum adriaticum]|uniref:Glycosyltransferase n=1 Tax=Catenovulum adriaticum TaxID=2984846 RepID=A0ABY7AIP2_9ALTE|nr:glycosyltransferase [Catenovulum sp. TS8]WAJ69374.1 glycosyltransferase [Catenovulum sp. TS8]
MTNKILLLSAEFPPYGGGAGVVAQSLASSLSSIGNLDITLVKLPFQGRFKWFGYSCFIFKFIMNLIVHRPNLVILNDQISALLGFIPSSFGINYVVLSHGSEDRALFGHPTTIKSILKVDKLYVHAVKNAAAYILPSKFQKRKMLKTPLEAYKSKFHVYPWGISEYEKTLLSCDGVKLQSAMKHLGPINILICARLTPGKGVYSFVSQLVKSAHELEKKVAVSILGSGEELPLIQELVNKCDPSKLDIKTIGWVDQKEVPKFYQESQVFVHTSTLPESYGLTFQDALIAKLKVFAIDVGALVEFEQFGQASFFNTQQRMVQGLIRWVNEDHDKWMALSRTPDLLSPRTKLVDFLLETTVE